MLGVLVVVCVLLIVGAYRDRLPSLYDFHRWHWDLAARTSAWVELVRRLGLIAVEDHVFGELEGFKLKIHPWLETGSCRVRVWLHEAHLTGFVPGPNPDPLTQTGDSVFDDDVRVTGERELVHALLDHEARRSLPMRLSEGCRIADGMIIWEGPLALGAVDDLVEHLYNLVQLARQVSCRPADVLARLAHNAMRDPCVDVRLACLDLLFERHGGAPITSVVAEAAMTDSNVLVAAVGMMFREPKRVPESALVATLSHADDVVRRWASEALSSVGTRDSVEPLVALTSGTNLNVRRAAVYALRGIRSRLQHSEQGGRLSLAAPQGGELSHAPAPAGALSIDDQH